MTGLPGFTGDLSLNRTSGNYRAVALLPGSKGWTGASEFCSGCFQPAFPRQPNGNGGNGSCRPGCGQCTEGPAGTWTKECQNPSCDDRTVRCVPSPVCGSC